MGKPFYLFSHSNVSMAGDELAVVQGLLPPAQVSDLITGITPGSTVIPRFRAIPFGPELERDVVALGATLLNSHREHRRIADIFAWAHLLEGLTPAVFGLEDMSRLPEGEYFAKGETNSLKNNWFTSAYAPDRASLGRVVASVLADAYVGTQRLAIRPFQHFRQLATAVDGRPVFHERRAFVLDGEVLSDAFYWSSFADELGTVAPLVPGAQDALLAEAVAATSHLARFYTVDTAEYPDGSWAVVELNDGCMAGLSENDPAVLWPKVFARLGN